MMDSRFANLVETLAPKLEHLCATPPFHYGERPRRVMPKRGVYLFTENGRHLYVGRSNSLRARFNGHCRHKEGSFALKLAYEEIGRPKATYRTKGGRAELKQHPKFAKAFNTAQTRIQKMDFRCAEESDPTGQALLEIYCAVVLDTPYNDFDTH